MPSLDVTGWLVLAAALTLGLFGGSLLARRIDGPKAMRLVIGLAGVGAVLALGQGVRSL